jgi:DTW domain-containing protein
MSQNQKINKTQACPQCFRPKAQCMCGKVAAFATRTRIVILQHPQEKLKLWNSARLANLALSNSSLRAGLSWPNLKKVAGADAQPGKWGVLYLKGNHRLTRPLQVFNRKEEPMAETPILEGIILLDGSWKQAHALWWRNPWLLRLNRIALNPEQASQRGQAKAAGLATIESAAHALRHLGEDPAVAEGLLRQYREFIVSPNRAGPGKSFPAAGNQILVDDGADAGG